MSTAAATDPLTFDAVAGLLAGGEELDAPAVDAVLAREGRTWGDLRARCDELAGVLAGGPEAHAAEPGSALEAGR